MKSQKSGHFDFPALALVIVVGILVGMVVWRILNPPEPVNIVIADNASGEAFSASSSLAMGERMGQSAEWTIATVLVIGSALVGLNWYQAERRYQRDIEEFNRKLADMDRRIKDAETTATQSIKFQAYRALVDQMGNPGQAGFVDRCIQLFRMTDIRDLRQIIATTLANWAESLESLNPTLPVMGDAPVLNQFLPEIGVLFPEEGKRIAGALPKAGTKYRASAGTSDAEARDSSASPRV